MTGPEAASGAGPWPEELRIEAKAVGVEVGAEAAELLGEFCTRVAAAPFRATATRDMAVLRRKHVVDSLACLPVAGLRAGERAVDLGTGAGFPGMVVAVMHPEVMVDLVDSRQKKALFVERMVRELGLRNVRVIAERAEHLAELPEWRAACDCVMARALAPLQRLAELALPLCRWGGRVVALKGPRADAELVTADGTLRRLGGRLTARRELSLPGGGERRVVLRFDREGQGPRLTRCVEEGPP